MPSAPWCLPVPTARRCRRPRPCARCSPKRDDGPCATLAEALTKVLGLFTPGTFVKLANGEIAVVHRRSAAANAPLVASITNGSENPYMKPLRRDTQQKDFAITGLTLRGKLTTGYDLGILWIKTL